MDRRHIFRIAALSDDDGHNNSSNLSTMDSFGTAPVSTAIQRSEQPHKLLRIGAHDYIAKLCLTVSVAAKG